MKRCLLTTIDLLPSLLELVCTKSIPLNLRKNTLETINRYDVKNDKNILHLFQIDEFMQAFFMLGFFFVGEWRMLSIQLCK